MGCCGKGACDSAFALRGGFALWACMLLPTGFEWSLRFGVWLRWGGRGLCRAGSCYRVMHAVHVQDESMHEHTTL